MDLDSSELRVLEPGLDILQVSELDLDNSELLELELDPGSSELLESVQGRDSSVHQESVLRSSEPLESVPQSSVRNLTARHIPESGS